MNELIQFEDKFVAISTAESKRCSPRQKVVLGLEKRHGEQDCLRGETVMAKALDGTALYTYFRRLGFSRET